MRMNRPIDFVTEIYISATLKRAQFLEHFPSSATRPEGDQVMRENGEI